ncbi:MAG: putative sulfate exporter family transporter, partial [Pseudomonadota bacterium]
AIAAVGVKTNLREVLAFGYKPLALILAETLFIAAFAACGFYAFYAV